MEYLDNYIIYRTAADARNRIEDRSLPHVKFEGASNEDAARRETRFNRELNRIRYDDKSKFTDLSHPLDVQE